MPRIFIPTPSVKDGQILITGEKARYLITVLRCRKGDELVVFDGKGNCLRTNILKADRREVIVEALEKFTCDTESPINILLAQGLLKGQKMDMVIQKATELGVKEIMPLITERSQPKETMKVERWRKIAEEASRQSGRSIIPLIHEPMHLNDYVSSLIAHHLSLHLKGFIFYEEGGMKITEAMEMIKQSLEGNVSDLQTSNPPSSPFTKGGQRGITEKGRNKVFASRLSPNVSVVIGPEGGFTKEEVAIAEEKGFIVTSLGKRILRAETAAISAITLVQFLLGDIG